MTGGNTDWKWPDLDEPELIDRLMLDTTAFRELWVSMVRDFPRRDFSSEDFVFGIGYPWPRPDGSFVLSEGEGRLLADLDRDTRAAVAQEFTGPRSGRTPMLAIGSNASPEGLWRKFGHFEDPEDRTLLALSGHLRDFDVVATAELALYGALPATLFPSPGTSVSAMAIWLTSAQITQLTWAEIPYWIGRLDTRFEFETELTECGLKGLDRALVFINRFGAFCPDGHPFALAAIPAQGRTAPALDQVELLEKVAQITIGAGASAQELIRLAFERPDEIGPKVAEVMRSNSIPFESDRWTPFPG